MCVLIFSTTLSEIFLKLRRIKQDIITNVRRVCIKYRYDCQILIKLEFCRQTFETSSNIKFHGNLFSGSRGIPCGQTD
jgi:hypothetical protein